MAIAHALTDTVADVGSAVASQSVTKPTSASGSHVLVLAIVNEFGNVTAQSSSLSAGWTQIGSTVSQGNGVNENVQVSAWWALGSVGATTVSNTQTGGLQQQGYVCAAFIGCDLTTPIDVAGTGNASTGAATLVTNAITIATSQAMHLICSGDWLGTSAQTATGFTVSENAHANAPTVVMYNTTLKSTGSTGTVTVNAASGGTQIIVALPFALRPASGGGGTDFTAILDADADMQEMEGGFGRVAARGRSYSFPRRMVPALSLSNGPRFERASGGLFVPRGIERIAA